MNLGANPLQVGFVPPLSYGGVNITALGATASRALDAYFADMPSVFNWGLHVATADTERHTAIQAAVTHCYTNGQDLYWPGDDTYVIDDTVDNFHDIKHTGNAKIQRGSDVWYITPRGGQRNILYASTTGTAAADGLSATQAKSIGSAWDIMKNLDSKAADGTWRIKLLSGTFTDPGILINNFPYFRIPLEFHGTSASLSDVPTSIWDGTGNASYAAIRGGLTSSESGFLNIEFQNIKFTNFSNNAIVYWYNGRVQMKNVHSDNIPYPFDYRGIRLDATGGVVKNYTQGYRPYYGCNSNIGGLGADESISFIGNNSDSVAVSVSRGGIAYIEGCQFSGVMAHNIAATLNTRVRTQDNVFGGNVSDVVLVEDSRWDQPKEVAIADTYPALTNDASAYSCRGASTIQNIHTYGLSGGGHLRSGLKGLLNSCSISGTTSPTVLSDASVGSTGFIPFRLPKYFLYSPTCKLRVELELALDAGHPGGVLSLHANGPGATTLLAQLNISASTPFQRGKAVMEFVTDPGASVGSYDSAWPVAGDYSNGSSANLNNLLVRDNNAVVQVYRLYWTSNGSGTENAYFSNLYTSLIA